MTDSRRRRWAFRLVAATLIPLLTLLAVESALRLGGVGEPSGFTTDCESEGRPAVCDNRFFSRRFFPPSLDRRAPSFAFPAQKEQGCYRIFLVGASAAQGDPDPTFGLARLLQTLLEQRYPAVRFEVINTAITAINSHVALPIASDLSAHDGDLFIIYLGNNEVVGPYGPASIISPLLDSRPIIRASILLRGTRTGQLFARMFGGVFTRRAFSEWHGMEMFLEDRIAADDPRLERVYSHFAGNLQGMIDVIRASGAKVLLSTVGVNLQDAPPFGAVHGTGLSERDSANWDQLYQEGAAHHSAGRDDEALASFLAAERIDAGHAELQYRLGRLFLEQGDQAGALARFINARDLDVLRFRADSRINAVIRALADRNSADDVAFLDAARMFESSGSVNTPDSTYFHEHVHLTFTGNYRLGRALLDEIEPLLPDTIRHKLNEDASLAEPTIARHLAYTDFDQGRIAAEVLKRLQRPPFTYQFDHDQQLQRRRQSVSELAALVTPAAMPVIEETYLEAMRRAPADPWLHFNHAQFMLAVEDYRYAASEFKTFLRALPHDVPAREKLASALVAQGLFEEAVTQCSILIDEVPEFSPPYYTMAYALSTLGRLEEGIAHYRQLLEIDPGASARIYNEIGRIQIHGGDYAQAADTYREAIEQYDQNERIQNPDLYFNYGFALKQSGDPVAARNAFRQAATLYGEDVAANPGSSVLQLALARSLVECGEFEEAALVADKALEALRSAGLHQQAEQLRQQFDVLLR